METGTTSQHPRASECPRPHPRTRWGRTVLLAAMLLAVGPGCRATRPVENPLARAFWQAVIAHDHEGVRFCLKAGMDPNSVNAIGNRPLHFSAQTGDIDTMALLLEAGAAPDARTRVGDTPLSLAAGSGHPDAVHLLLRQGAASSAEALHAAAGAGQSAIAILLIEAGADVNKHARDGMTPLHAAVATRHADTVRTLLQAGADPHLQATTGEVRVSALDVALAIGDAAVLEPFPPARPAEPPVAAGERPAPAREPVSAPGGEPASTSAPVQLDREQFLRHAEIALRGRYPELDMAAFRPGYLIVMQAPADGAVRVVSEWVGTTPLRARKGDAEGGDRIEVRKFRVHMDASGAVQTMTEGTTWLYRAGSETAP